MFRLLQGLVVLTIVIFLAPSAGAATITIGSSKDASIFENNVDNSNGAGPGMFAGTNAMNSIRRSLLAFDVAGSVPAGATITAVQLTLFLGQVAGGDDANTRTIGLHELLADWGEGTTGSSSTMIGGTGQGFAANAGDATWNAAFFPATLWTTPGSDHNATASASTAVTGTIDAPYVWLSTPALVSNAQGWLDTPATNFGWALVNQDEATASTFRAFYTKEFSDAALRPQLEITYDLAQTAVPEPTSVALLGLGLVGFVVVSRRARSLR